MPSETYDLAIETSGDLCSVAIGLCGEVVREETRHMPYGQAAHILGLMEEVGTAFNNDWSRVARIIVNRGPGSFTGLRVGLSVAEGLSCAGGVPLLGVTGFQIYRALYGAEQGLQVVLDSRRDGLFTAFFEKDAWHPMREGIMGWEEIKQYRQNNKDSICLTNVASLEGEAGVIFQPISGLMVLKAYPFLRESGGHFSREPLYLRPPEIHGNR